MNDPKGSKTSNSSLIECFHDLIDFCKGHPQSLSIETFLSIFSEKTLEILIVLFALPFCIPLLPGLSTPFGLILIYLGLSVVFQKPLFLPQWILKKSLSSSFVEKFAVRGFRITKKIQKIFHPRIRILSTILAKRFHGIFIVLLAFLLALPLPIPFTNILPAIPIVCLGWGLLEEDGLVILLGYLLSFLCFGFFMGLIIESYRIL